MKSKRGMLLICVLVCLGIASTITGITIQSSLRARKQMKRHWQLEQTRVLLDAGVRRAIAKSQAGDSAWEQPWDVSDAFDSFAVASVMVESGTDGPADQGNYRIIAEMKTDDTSPTVTRRSRVISIPN